ncbi:ankyrin repeat and protein kinase domain-containing protein [Anaeramoeba flamelloides]|uniref:Ankyrin repeat and protein kinase domain-containing protein n=1 Tax=Anaeramoeba flamelloides TaxID=1746091 RepID=A0ABQ8Y8W5_9EUKA|nr:ankyrin repeat and protein kinase domain-containing protein [Anaeramoeba flamelloides]
MSSLLQIILNGSHEELKKYLKRNNSQLKETITTFEENPCKDRGLTYLHVAVLVGKPKLIKLLIKKGCPIDQQTSLQSTALHLAIEHDQTECQTELLTMGSDPCLANNKGETALHLCIRKKNSELFPLLADFQKLHFYSNIEGQIPLTQLSKDNDLKNIKKYLEAIKDSKLRSRILNTTDSRGMNALHYFSQKGSLKGIVLITKYGINIEAQTGDLQQSIHLAARNGHTNIIKYFIRDQTHEEKHDQKKEEKTKTQSAPKNILNSLTCENKTPLMCAAESQKEDVLKLLIKLGAKLGIEDNKGANIMHYLAKNGDLATIQRIYKLKPGLVSATDNNNKTPLIYSVKHGKELVANWLSQKKGAKTADYSQRNVLHIAAIYGHSNILKNLLERAFKVDPRTDNGETPLHLSCKYGHFECVKILIQYKANLNAETSLLWTPIHLVTKSQSLKIAQYLVEKGCDVHTKTGYESNVVHHVCQEGNNELLKFFIKCGGDINAQNNGKASPLHLAVAGNHQVCVQTLINNKALLNLQDNNGDTPLHLAIIFRHKKLVKLLKLNNACTDIKNSSQLTQSNLINYTNKKKSQKSHKNKEIKKKTNRGNKRKNAEQTKTKIHKNEKEGEKKKKQKKKTNEKIFHQKNKSILMSKEQIEMEKLGIKSAVSPRIRPVNFVYDSDSWSDYEISPKKSKILKKQQKEKKEKKKENEKEKEKEKEKENEKENENENENEKKTKKGNEKEKEKEKETKKEKKTKGRRKKRKNRIKNKPNFDINLKTLNKLLEITIDNKFENPVFYYRLIILRDILANKNNLSILNKQNIKKLYNHINEINNLTTNNPTNLLKLILNLGFDMSIYHFLILLNLDYKIIEELSLSFSSEDEKINFDTVSLSNSEKEFDTGNRNDQNNENDEIDNDDDDDDDDDNGKSKANIPNQMKKWISKKINKKPKTQEIKKPHITNAPMVIWFDDNKENLQILETLKVVCPELNVFITGHYTTKSLKNDYQDLFTNQEHLLKKRIICNNTSAQVVVPFLRDVLHCNIPVLIYCRRDDYARKLISEGNYKNVWITVLDRQARLFGAISLNAPVPLSLGNFLNQMTKHGKEVSNSISKMSRLKNFNIEERSFILATMDYPRKNIGGLFACNEILDAFLELELNIKRIIRSFGNVKFGNLSIIIKFIAQRALYYGKGFTFHHFRYLFDSTTEPENERIVLYFDKQNDKTQNLIKESQKFQVKYIFAPLETIKTNNGLQEIVDIEKSKKLLKKFVNENGWKNGFSIRILSNYQTSKQLLPYLRNKLHSNIPFLIFSYSGSLYKVRNFSKKYDAAWTSSHYNNTLVYLKFNAN